MAQLDDYRSKLVAALNGIDLERVQAFLDVLSAARDAGNTIFTCGNGGSAATASHFATDLGKGASYGKPSRFKVLALTDSISTITAYANDVSYEVVFAEQLINHAKPGDVLVCITGSGNSPNVLRSVEAAKELGVTTVAMTGFAGGQVGPMVDIHINVPDDHMGRIEDAHMSLCHMTAFSFIDGHHEH
jgi:D-sedoheptulose 7-phosphate isomerase